MIYQIQGIKNKIEWDGINPPKLLCLDRKGYRRPFAYKHSPNRILYDVLDDQGKRIRISQGRILFMLRTGISLQQCIENKISVTEDGRLREERVRNRQWPLFSTLAECKETIRIIEDLSNGNPASFYALMTKEKNFLRLVMARSYGICQRRFNELYDDTLEATEEQLKTFHFRAIRKIHYYFINKMLERNHRRPRNLTCDIPTIQ